MFEWILNNLASVIVLSVVAAVITLVIIKMVRDKRRGKPSCNCGCGGCPMKDTCHTKK